MTKAKARPVPIDQLIGRRLKQAVKLESGRGAGFGRRLAGFLGKEWTRQMVYDAGQGQRKFRVSELVAFARATRQPAHYFLDATAAGAEKVEVDPRAEAVDAAELKNMFRIPEPRDMSRDVAVAVQLIEGVIEDLAAQARELDHAARLINGTYWKDFKEGKLS